jgi:hypothetical protein
VTGGVGSLNDGTCLGAAAPAEAGNTADCFRILLRGKALLDARQIDDVARKGHGG